MHDEVTFINLAQAYCAAIARRLEIQLTAARAANPAR